MLESASKMPTNGITYKKKLLSLQLGELLLLLTRQNLTSNYDGDICKASENQIPELELKS